jgi:DNA polymerase elongation subunit (family B)
MLVGFDLETFTDGTDPTGAPLGLDPRYTHIISAAVWTDNSHEFFVNASERKLLSAVNEFFMDIADKESVVVTWNGANFDLPFVVTRAAANDLKTGISYVTSPLRPPKYRTCPGFDGGLLASWGGLDHVDIMYPYKAYAEEHDIKYSLKPVTTYLGLDPIEVDATKMQDLSDQELEAYNLSDVRVTHGAALLMDPAVFNFWRDSRAPRAL